MRGEQDMDTESVSRTVRLGPREGKQDGPGMGDREEEKVPVSNDTILTGDLLSSTAISWYPQRIHWFLNP